MIPRSAAQVVVRAIVAAAAVAATAPAAAAPDLPGPAQIDDDPTTRPASRETHHDEPASVEAPRMRNVEPRTRLYVDATYAESGDLSALPTIAGSARGARLALGGSLKLSRFQLDVEFPVGQATHLDLIDVNEAIMIDPNDKHQTSYALGDSRLGAQWTAPLPIATNAPGGLSALAGFGLGLRVPTHTGKFTFHYVDGSEGTYVLPYYFQVQPALLFGAYAGPVAFVVNQDALILLGPDGEVGGLPVVTPTIYFWDAHYAVAVHLGPHFLVSLGLNTTVQLNHLDPVQFPRLNDVRSAFVTPGVALRLGAYRIDLVGRVGAASGANTVGVIMYAGTSSITLRLTRELD